jgi:hypothetical protein
MVISMQAIIHLSLQHYNYQIVWIKKQDKFSAEFRQIKLMIGYTIPYKLMYKTTCLG